MCTYIYTEGEGDEYIKKEQKKKEEEEEKYIMRQIHMYYKVCKSETMCMYM